MELQLRISPDTLEHVLNQSFANDLEHLQWAKSIISEMAHETFTTIRPPPDFSFPLESLWRFIGYQKYSNAVKSLKHYSKTSSISAEIREILGISNTSDFGLEMGVHYRVIVQEATVDRFHLSQEGVFAFIMLSRTRQADLLRAFFYVERDHLIGQCQSLRQKNKMLIEKSSALAVEWTDACRALEEQQHKEAIKDDAVEEMVNEMQRELESLKLELKREKEEKNRLKGEVEELNERVSFLEEKSELILGENGLTLL